MERSNEIQSELVAISQKLADIPFTNVFQIPANYFEELSVKTEQLIMYESNDLNLISEKIQSVNYQVPTNYFNDLPDNIINAIYLEKDNVKKLRFNFKNIALAACIVGLLGFFIFNLLISDPKPKIDKNTAELISQANQILHDKKLETEIDNLSEAELVKFVEENGQDVEAALVASLGDEVELSESDLYFYDDESLHHYLTEQNIYKKITNSN